MYKLKFSILAILATLLFSLTVQGGDKLKGWTANKDSRIGNTANLLISAAKLNFAARLRFVAANYQPLPGKIEAESYSAMKGISTGNTTDVGGGLSVTATQKNDWLDYNVSVTSAGTYTFNVRVAGSGGQLQLRTASGTTLKTLDIPATGGGQNWTTVSTTVSLQAGNQILRIFIAKGGWNFNWFELLTGGTTTTLKESVITFNALPEKTVGDAAFSLVATSTNTETPITFSSSNAGVVSVSNSTGKWMVTVVGAGTAIITASQAGSTNFKPATDITQTQVVKSAVVTGSYKPLPGKIEAESFDAMAGIATETTTDTGAGHNVGWIDANDWLDYNVNVASAGTYTFSVRVAGSGGQLQLRNASGSVITTLTLPTTGAWQTWTTVSTMVSLSGGNQTLRMHAVSGGWNFNWFEITGGGTSSTTRVKIPIDGNRWYQLNTTTGGLEGLSDERTDVDIQTGWSKVLANYDAYYPLLDGEEITIDAVKFFDGYGYDPDKPMTLSIIDAQWNRIPVATFTGSSYGWVGPDPNQPAVFDLKTVAKGARYLVLNMWNIYPTEIELYGSYKAPASPPTSAPLKPVRLKDMFGINAYEWNFEDGNTPWQLNESKVKVVKNFTGVRHYMDWERIESTEGSYTFNPTHSGGWNYDAIYERCKAEGIEVLACLKTIPKWLMDTYPEGQRDEDNVPVRYGKDFADPRSYIEQAKVGFQYIARYGSNRNVDPSLVKVNSTQRWTGDGINTVKIGMGLIKYIECDNERDKWWEGRRAYQTAREYAANLSAFYDGHKNTMGPAVGVKNADPTIQVVIAGICTNKDYVKGMIDWCRQYRGYRPDGSVDVCWDVINYHYYTFNSAENRGSAPELSPAAQDAKGYVQVAHQQLKGMPVWITEAGYDVNQGSPLKAIPIGPKSELVTQADWVLRSALLYARNGIDKLFFYQLYDAVANSSGQYATSGLANESTLSRRPAADYLYQVNKQFGEYRYQQTLANDPIVDRYSYNGQSMYMLVIPDEKGRTGEYTLDLGSATSAKIYKPKAGSDIMEEQQVPTSSGKLKVTVTETPAFVIPVSGARLAAPAEPTGLSMVQVYPNPTTAQIQIAFDNEQQVPVQVRVLDTALGRVYQQISYEKQDVGFRACVDLSALPVGLYLVEVSQGQKRVLRKVIKVQ
ncbi:hypothetical protein GCM10023189_09010 [Nibrella saemangeumensis]|uniref:CBM6 domain-containing protein n=1 Tax=Nibrella saemangeumensis TaxID=1084526 RepID=A0ABP8MIL9_9BACT